jgi:hypothetical protein
MVVEKEVGGNEANDKSLRPVLSEMTSNTTLSVPQVVNTIPRPVVENHAGMLVFFLRICTWDQINHKLFSLWVGPEGSDSGNGPTQAGQGGDAQAPQKQEVDHVAPGVYVLHGRVSMRSDASINDQHLLHLSPAVTIMTSSQDVRKPPR